MKQSKSLERDSFGLFCISNEPITKTMRAKGLKYEIDLIIVSFKILAASIVKAVFAIEDAHINL